MVISPKWSELNPGDTVDVVVKSVALNIPGNHNLVRTMDHSGRWLLVQGSMGVEADHYVCLGLVIGEIGKKVVVFQNDATFIRPMPPPNADSFGKLVELCCGLGAWSSISGDADLRTIAGVDHNAKWGPLFTELHPGAHFLTGDIADRKVLCDLHDLGAAGAVTAAGISCQPHSRAGDRRGMQDDRAVSLPRAILAGWLLQSPVIILECVQEIAQDKEAMSMLQQACQEGGYHMRQKVLRLQDLWCARRDRWFCVLSALPIGPIQVDDLPSTNMFSTVGTVMPYIRDWPRQDLGQITLGLYELCKFYDFASGGIDNLYIKMDAQMPTSLHSIGNQMYPCACGCRAALSLERMSTHGLFGVLVPMDECFVHENMQRRACRYPHPCELFMLNGGLPSTQFRDNMRLALAGVGQCVSPLQGLWTLAQIRKQCCEFLNLPLIDHVKILETYITKLRGERDALWPPLEIPNAPMLSQHSVAVIWTGDQSRLQVEVDPRDVVANLVSAEATIRAVEPTQIQVTDATGCSMDLQCALGLCTELYLCIPSAQPEVRDAKTSLPCLECPCHEWASGSGLSPTVPFEIELPSSPDTDASTDSGIRCLTSMTQTQLINVVCPKFQPGDRVDIFTDKTITSCERVMVLDNQKEAWGDDEIRRCLARITRDAPVDQQVVMWDPLLMTSCALKNNDCAAHFEVYVSALAVNATVVSAVLCDKHWYPIMWRCDASSALMFTCHSGPEHPVLAHIHGCFCAAKGFPFQPYKQIKPQFEVVSHCGAMVVSFLEHLVWGTPLPGTAQEIALYHSHLRLSFSKALDARCLRPWIWGLGDTSWKGQLESLLREHGVEPKDAPTRAALVIEKLGESTVSKSMTSSQPWRDLKWHANSCLPPFQLIRPGELQAAISRRVASGEDVGRKSQKKIKAKGGGKGKQVSAALDAHGLRVDNGIFQSGNDTPLSQIDLAQLSPQSSGIILVNTADAMPYLKGGKQVSVGAVGMILIDSLPSQVHTPLIPEQVKFPVTCLANAEPLLVEGVMFQLGAIPVRRSTPAVQCTLVALDSCVIRALVFRDMIDMPWEQFREHPMRLILSLIPVLRPCDDPNCQGDCESWHHAEKCALDDPLMEIWHRQWLTHAFTSVPPDRADCFSVHMRLPSCLQIQVQHYSGTNGVFLEPRQVDGKTPSETFQVIWMPKSSFEELRHLKQTTAGVIGIARLGMKMGLRCLSEVAQVVHAEVRPGSSYLPAGRKMHFLMGPFPYGTLKDSIAKALSAMPWSARPLQPVASAKDMRGVMWKIQAISCPPATVVISDCGELVISKLDDPVPFVPQKPAVVATTQTLQLCSQAKGSSQIDPLQVHDPWANHTARRAQGSQAAVPCPIDALEQKLVDAVLSKLPKESMEVDSKDEGMEARVHLLERKVTELHEGQCHLQMSTAENAKQQTLQIQQLQQQGQRLETVVADNVSQISSFQSQFQRQLEQQQTTLDGLFQQQLDRIEDLFSKRPRKE